jgi:hypothetical protein
MRAINGFDQLNRNAEELQAVAERRVNLRVDNDLNNR